MNKNKNEYDAAYAERQLLRSRNPLRRFVKNFYLANILNDIEGSTIDFGCGAGQLLARLPPDSLGLEVNLHLVRALTAAGMNVEHYDPSADGLTFSQLPEKKFKTFVMSHVLEHFEDAENGLKQILASCLRLGVQKVIVVVPGQKGYLFDHTHRTFVTKNYIKDRGLIETTGYQVRSFTYFPVNMETMGNLFIFHEMKIVYEKC